MLPPGTTPVSRTSGTELSASEARGTISTTTIRERERPELAARRAHSVAEALFRAGVPREMIEVSEEVGPETLAGSEADLCPPRAEDEHGDPRRHVHVLVVRCERRRAPAPQGDRSRERGKGVPRTMPRTSDQAAAARGAGTPRARR